MCLEDIAASRSRVSGRAMAGLEGPSVSSPALHAEVLRVHDAAVLAAWP